jgi:creatinine amidohydrolase
MKDEFQSVQIELLMPHEIRSAMDACPVVFLPLGTYEWHAEHLPIGLDALTAQGVCLHTAARDGGLVCPPLYYGTGGGHGDYPFTIMMEDEKEIVALLHKSLVRFQDFGMSLAVLFSGHFAPQQISMIEDIAAEWNAGGNEMKVLALAMNMGEDIPIEPDHAGLFETTLLAALWPDRVDFSQLPPLKDGPDVDKGESPFGSQRHDPQHPLYGIFGPDPRTFVKDDAQKLLDAMVSWFSGQVQRALR